MTKNEKFINRNSKNQKKMKIFGVKNFELDMLDAVFRPQEHDALR